VKHLSRAPLSILVELGETLGSPLNLRASMREALEAIVESFRASAAYVALPEGEGPELSLAAWTGASPTAAARLRIKPGEGIAGRVWQSGKPVIVPQVTKEPLFLDRLGLVSGRRAAARELSYLAVAIPVGGRPAGVLAMSLPYEKDRDFAAASEFLSIAASMFGQALRVSRLLDAERTRMQEENRQLKEQLSERYDLPNVIGTSHPMQQVYEKVAQAAPASTTVLIQGESGTGKELVAHALHQGSPRAGRAFVKVNCAALPESLIESELFGYEPGAFTGAQALKKGRFELADGGTLFLDEVGDLSPATQVKLLRVLQEREFERLGGVKPVRVDVRLVTATNRDLSEMMSRGAFREDLFYRLNVFTIFMPPLRERKPDLPLLADHFVERYAARHGKSVRRISTSAIDVLMSYHWPGNVRELENCLERAVLVCDGGVIHAHHLPPTLQTAEVSGTLPRQSLADAVGAFEKDLLLDALKISRGNRAQAARLLRTTERILAYRAKKLGIDASRFRS
jgi:Nif-specific regulatory protein